MKINYNSSSKKIGNKGEELAVKFLEDKNYSIIQRNFKFGQGGEIDIIAQIDNILVFVEVKTRTNLHFGNPIQQISATKRTNWRNAAEGYLFKNNITNQECRLDLIAINMFNDKIEITHIENAF
jgi:putative endonuclease